MRLRTPAVATTQDPRSQSLLQVRDLSVAYRRQAADATPALDGLDLTLEAGQTVGLIGSSGSGKSTAANAVLGLLPDTASTDGSVRFDGHDLLRMTDRDWRRLRWERLALVPQAAMNSLDPVMAVDKQIAEVVRAHRDVSQRVAIGMARDALGEVGIHRDRASSYPHQFSGGMRQRALIAMATVLEPTVLIADEPTTGLDVIVQDRVLALLLRAKETFGLSLMVITHDLGVAAELCDRMVMLEDGRTVAAGSRAEVLATLPAVTSPLPDSTGDDHTEDPTPPALEARDISVRYSSGRGLAALRRSSELSVLAEVSLTVRPGEIVGLAGESGCGKSSLVAALAGLQPLADGSIRIDGIDVADREGAHWRPLRRRLQMIFQDPYDSLNPRLTVWQTVGEPLVAQGIGKLDEPACLEKVVSALEDAGLTPGASYLDRYPRQLSGGERQRVAIARALVVGPSVILADEPVSMLDEENAEGIVTLLVDLARRLDVAVLLVSHDVSLLRRVCHRVAIMYLGAIVETGSARDVLDSPRHPYSDALIRAVPSRDPATRRERVLLPGEPPSLRNRPTGCAFHPRCPRATDACSTRQPELVVDLPDPSRRSDPSEHAHACWHPMNDTTPTRERTT